MPAKHFQRTITFITITIVIRITYFDKMPFYERSNSANRCLKMSHFPQKICFLYEYASSEYIFPSQ